MFSVDNSVFYVDNSVFYVDNSVFSVDNSVFSVDDSVFSVDKISRLKDSNIQSIKSSQYPVLLLSTLTQQRKPLLDLRLLEVKVMSRV